MNTLPARLMSIRGRLAFWYLGVVAILLFGVCLTETMTLGGYLRSTAATTMAQAARSELAIAGPCRVQSPAELRRRAGALAQALGSGSDGASIVSVAGRPLASQFSSASGTDGSSAVSVALTRRLIGESRLAHQASLSVAQKSSCRGVIGAASGSPTTNTAVEPTIRSGILLLMAIPLGPPARPVGYAILEHSMATEDGTLFHVRLSLWLSAAVALAIAALVALPIINRALRPLRHVTGTAEAIAAGDLAQRANLAPSIDEIGRLGRAFDGMVDRLQAAIAAASASEERMRHFLADASHELRTPLTVLRGTSQVLLRQPELGREDVDSALVAIHSEANRLSRLVDDLLTLSRLDAGGSLEPQPVPMSAFLEGFLERYASAWPSRTIQVDAAGLDGVQANVDPEALRRMLTNLVDNAARYSAVGKPIAIAGEATEDGISIMVRDEGPGLNREDAERVFERFYRAGKSRSRVNGGSGLGLSIVRALVQQSHGHISIDTGPDRGTTVVIALPG